MSDCFVYLLVTMLSSIQINDSQIVIVHPLNNGSLIEALIHQINKFNLEFSRQNVNEIEFRCLIVDFIEQIINKFTIICYALLDK